MTANGVYSLRARLGVLLLDCPRYVVGLARRDGWIKARNRCDVLQPARDGRGVALDSEVSSDLHACHVFPALGSVLMRQAMREWPFELATESHSSSRPDLSFVIPFRGKERVPVLVATLRSIFAQRGVSLECIVVEQNAAKEVEGLPEGVRHIHLAHPTDPTSWRKCWAFNVGVAAASADIVVCHDADILVPTDYGREVLGHLRSGGRDVVHLHRFLFCLGERASAEVTKTLALGPRLVPERVRQGWKGGTLAIRRDRFAQVGGFDESFVGWTGEDIEFYDRCRVLNGSRHGYLPFIHLWHPPQSMKVSASDRRRNERHTQELLDTPRTLRVERLCRRQAQRLSAVGPRRSEH